MKSSLVKKYQMNGNVYDLADYSRKGLLIDAYHELGEKGVERELKLLIPFMYCSGRGLTLKQGHLFNLSTINNAPTTQSKSSSNHFLHRKKVSSLSSSSSPSAAGDKYSTPFSVSEILLSILLIIIHYCFKLLAI